MSRKPILIPATIIIGLLLVLACTITPSVAPQPASTADPNQFATIVAGTAAVLMEQTALAKPTIIIPTETPFIETTPTRPSTGSVLTEQSDGTTYFADAVTGLEMTIPSGWMAIRIGEAEYYRAWESDESKRFDFTDMLTNLSRLDPNKVRLVALDIQEGHLQHQVSTNIILQTGHAYTLEEGIENHLTHHRAIFDNVKVISQNSGEIFPGIPAISLEVTYDGISFSSGEIVRAYENLIFFTANGQVTSIKLETLDELRTTVSPQFQQIITGLVFYTP